MQTRRGSGGREHDHTFKDACLDVVVISGEIPRDTDRASAFKPVDRRPGSRDAPAFEVIKALEGEGRHQQVVVQREAATEIFDIIGPPAIGHAGDRLVQCVHRIKDKPSVGSGEGREITDVLQGQRGGFEHGGHDADFSEAVLQRFELAADVCQRAAISFCPGDLIGRALESRIDGWNEGLGELLEPTGRSPDGRSRR